jgi:hypothetical protein
VGVEEAAGSATIQATCAHVDLLIEITGEKL